MGRRVANAPYCFNHYMPQIPELTIIAAEKLFNPGFREVVKYGTEIAKDLLEKSNRGIEIKLTKNGVIHILGEWNNKPFEDLATKIFQ